jgi:hypothetical protein
MECQTPFLIWPHPQLQVVTFWVNLNVTKIIVLTGKSELPTTMDSLEKQNTCEYKIVKPVVFKELFAIIQ